jgi:DNA repair exonuclease SbcCD nuclease subunit
VNILIVGDPHARFDDQDDLKRLFQLITQSLERHNPDFLFFLGDLYHNHAHVHTELQKLWQEAFDLWARSTKIISLVGNHDRAGDSNITSHALQLHQNVTVIDKPMILFDKLGCIPYYHDKELFTKHVNELKVSLLVCHNTVGSVEYQPGVLVKDTIDDAALNVTKVLAGHLHTPTNVGKVWYPGSPRHLTATDANSERFLYLVDEDMNIIEKISTQPYVRYMYKFEIKNEEDVQTVLAKQVKDTDKIICDLHGTKQFCTEVKKLISTQIHARFREYYTDKAGVKVRESDGIKNALFKHLDQFSTKNKTHADVLKQWVMRDLGDVLT